MARINSKVLLLGVALAAASFGTAQADVDSANTTVPTVIVKVEQMAAANANSTATFTLVNGKSAVALMTATGDIEAHSPTDIRFVFDASQSGIYAPIGITFKHSDAGTADKAGSRNFPSREVSNGALTVKASVLDAASFKYSILFERVADGAVGVIDPQVINVPEA